MEYNFGDLLKQKRESVGLSQKQLAQALGQRFTDKKYSKVTISKWEGHYSTPKPAVIVVLEMILGTPPGFLLGAAGHYEVAEARRQEDTVNQLKEFVKSYIPQEFKWDILQQEQVNKLTEHLIATMVITLLAIATIRKELRAIAAAFGFKDSHDQIWNEFEAGCIENLNQVKKLPSLVAELKARGYDVDRFLSDDSATMLTKKKKGESNDS